MDICIIHPLRTPMTYPKGTNDIVEYDCKQGPYQLLTEKRICFTKLNCVHYSTSAPTGLHFVQENHPSVVL